MAEPNALANEVTAETGKKAIKTRDLTQGSIVNNLLRLSWPMIVMEATYMVSQIWDMLWVGKGGGANGIAAVGVGGLVMMMVNTIDMSIISGARAMISRFFGAREFASAKQVMAQAYMMGFCWGLVVTLLGSLFAPVILSLLGLESSVVAEGTRYLRILFAGWVTLELLIIGLYNIQSTGDSFNPMLIEFLIRAVHLVLCPFLVMGYWFFPALGISGAAISNVAGQALGAVAGLVLLFSGYTRIKLSLSDFRFKPGIAWRMMKIGIPSMVSMLQTNFAMLLITRIISPFGTLAVAANSLAGTVQNFILTPSFGMGAGVSVLVGQNLGAKQPQRAVKSAWTGAAILIGFMLVCGVVILIWAESIIGLFDKDPGLIAISADFLRISTAAFLVLGLNYALMSGISGAGDTLPNMLVSIGMIWLFQVPFTYILANYTGLGVYGIRWAVVISSFAGAIAYFLYFQSGRWKRKKV